MERNVRLTTIGYKATKDENPDYLCPHCKTNNVFYREYDGDYEDIEYVCVDCGKDWWFEGSDY